MPLSSRSFLSRVYAVIAAASFFLVAGLLGGTPQGACAQEVAIEAAPDTVRLDEMRPSPVWTGVNALAGAAIGLEKTFFYAKATVPVAVARRWAVGPTAAIFFQSARGDEQQRGNDLSDDRGAVGLEVRRAFGVSTYDGVDDDDEGTEFGRVPEVDQLCFYAGGSLLYSLSQGKGQGFMGGLVGGGHYAPSRRLAVGLEIGLLRGPEQFLFIPVASVAIRL
jgi:hypothetical protein